MPSDTEVLPDLDLGEPPQELLDWAREHLNENPETRDQVLQDFRDMIFGKKYIFFTLNIISFVCFRKGRVYST